MIQNTLVRGATDRHDYLGFMGTSMAAPHVAGTAALLRAEGLHDPDTLETVLTRSAKDRNDRRRYGAGLLQADAALALAQQGLGGFRGFAALLASLGLLLVLRRRRLLGVAPLTVTGVAVWLAGGLAVVPWHGMGLNPAVAHILGGASKGLPSALASATSSGFAPLLLSALVPFVLAALLLGWRRAAPVVAGAAIAFATWLVIEACVPTVEVGLLPAWLVGPWLLCQGALAAGLAYLSAMVPSRSR